MPLCRKFRERFRFLRIFILTGLSGVWFLSLAQGQQLRVLGLDISAWQGNISQTTWNNIHNVENRQFIILRSSRGGTTGYYDQNNSDNSPPTNTQSQRYDDPYYIQNINRVTTAGMFAGSYHFSRPDIIETTLNSGGVANTGTDEADHFIQMAGPWMRPGYLIPVHDFEAGDGVRTDNEMAQFCIDFSNRIYEKMRIRPAIYTSGNYAANILGGASASLRDELAKPPAALPSVVSPCYPYLWSARWPNQTNPDSIDVQNGEPKDSYSAIYGPWDDYGVTHPWKFWQYASTIRLQSYNNGGSNLDADVARGGIEFLKDQLVPAVWWHDGDGDWSTLTNWNSGQTPVAPVTGTNQVPPVATGPLPTPRLPGGSGAATTSGTNDTVILERPNTNITVTLSTGNHTIRKLYMRETLNITGGSLTMNYVPSWDSTTNGAEFSGPVTLSGSGSLSVHTLQVDTNRTFTLAGGTVTLNTISLMPHSTSPAKIQITGNVTLNALANASAVIANGSGAGTSGLVDLGGGGRSLTIGNGTATVDLSINAPVTNGSLTKAGAGTLALTGANTYSGGTTVSAGRLLVNNASGSGTGSGAVTVSSGGTLGGTGTISGAVTVSNGGTVSPGASVGTLTLNTPPAFSGTNFMEIDRNGGFPLADKIVLTSGTLTYGGTLVVSNAGAALMSGDVFTLFSAPAYAGSFAATSLPVLDAGLSWDLSGLAVDGTIKVIDSSPTSPPAISGQPQSLTVAQGSNSTFTATASGTAPLSYQWRFNSGDISGATQNAYTRSNAQPSHAGSYALVVTNNYGSTTSSVATLTVIVPPTVTNQPQSQNVNPGDNASFTVGASGTTPFGYQWRKNGSAISGATQSSHNVSNAQSADAGSYSVVISNFAGTATSSDAVLTIAAVAPTISAQPTNRTAFYGDPASFIVVAGGNPAPGYQWRFNGANLAGATQSMLTLSNVTNTHAGSYSVIVTNSAGSITSQVAVLTVNPSFPVGSLKVLWSLAPYSRSYLTTNSLPFERGMAYNPLNRHVLVASRNGPHIYVLDGDSNADINEMNMTGVSGGTYLLLMVGVADDGVVYAGNLTTGGVGDPYKLYRWANDSAGAAPTLAYSGDPGSGNSQRWGDTIDVRGAGTNTQVIIASRSTNLVAVLTTTNGTNFTARTITVSDAVPGGPFGLGIGFGAGNTFWGKATSQSLRQCSFDLVAGTGSTLRSHGSPTPPNTVGPIGTGGGFNVVGGISVGGPGTNYFQLYDLTTNNGTPVLIATTNLASDFSNSGSGTGAADFNGDRIFVFGANNGLLALQMIPTAPTITNQPQNQTVAVGQNATFVVGAAGANPLSYQWRFNNANVSGATQSSYTRTNAQLGDAGTYSVIVTNAGGSVTSSNAVLTVNIVNVAPTIGTHPQSLTVTQGNNATFTGAASGTPAPTYQWRFNGVNIAGATGTSYTRTNAQAVDTGSYTMVASNVAGSATSSVATLTVRIPPSIAAHPQGQIVNLGAAVTFNVGASGEAPLGYQWRLNGTNIPGGTTSAWQMTNAQTADAGSYSVVVTNPVGNVVSADALLTVIGGEIRFDAITRLPNLRYKLHGTGSVGNYIIELTTNFTSWHTGATISNTNGVFEWTDPETNHYQRYYRAKLVP